MRGLRRGMVVVCLAALVCAVSGVGHAQVGQVLQETRETVDRFKEGFSQSDGHFGDRLIEGMIEAYTPESDEEIRKIQRDAVKLAVDPDVERSREHLGRIEQNLTGEQATQGSSASAQASSRCSADQVLQLVDKGFSRQEILEYCGTAQTSPTQSSITTTPAQPGKTWTEPHTGMEFVWVPGGCFQMGCGSWSSECEGDEKPVHEVCVDGFWMGRYEVTQAQWEKVMGNNPSRFKGPDNPVEQVSWRDAQDFVRELTFRGSGAAFRLPTEAEWEYACRGGGRQEKYCGGDNVNSVAWYKDNSGGKTQPVGRKSPNALGLYDMSGNVWEWVEDFYHKNAYSRTNRHKNPVVADVGSYRVLRGGSGSNVPRNVRSALRNWRDPGDRYDALGFRLLRTP